jgi:hypothetical protein
LFRGYYARKYTVLIKKTFRNVENVMNAMVRGWRIRKIMKTKEIENYVL